MVKNLHVYQTPGTSDTGVIHPSDEIEKIDPHEQKLYRSGVGMLLYLIKNLQSDITNVVVN